MLLISAVVFLLVHFPFSENLTKQINQSRFLPAITVINRMIQPLLPDASKLPQGLPSIIDPKNIDLKMLDIDPGKLNIDVNSKEYQQLKGYLDQIIKTQGDSAQKEKKQPAKK